MGSSEVGGKGIEDDRGPVERQSALPVKEVGVVDGYRIQFRPLDRRHGSLVIVEFDQMGWDIEIMQQLLEGGGGDILPADADNLALEIKDPLDIEFPCMDGAPEGPDRFLGEGKPFQPPGTDAQGGHQVQPAARQLLQAIIEFAGDIFKLPVFLGRDPIEHLDKEPPGALIEIDDGLVLKDADPDDLSCPGRDAKAGINQDEEQDDFEQQADEPFCGDLSHGHSDLRQESSEGEQPGRAAVVTPRLPGDYSASSFFFSTGGRTRPARAANGVWVAVGILCRSESSVGSHSASSKRECSLSWQ